MDANNSFIVFSGSSHEGLAKEIARELGKPLGKILIETFPDGETGVQILENVRGRDVFVLQSVARNPNHYLMELLIIADALKRASARSVAAIIPYYGYARQDRKDKGREPITARLVANLLERAGITRVVAMDLHTEQIQGFFDLPLDHLYARPVFEKALRELNLANPIVVSPDVGSNKMARKFAEDLKLDLAIVDKRRVGAKKVEVNAIIGDVRGKEVILVDDICSTGGTLKLAASACKMAGAKKVIVAVTHGLLLEDVFQDSGIELLITTNTVVPLQKNYSVKLQTLSVAPLFAQAVERIVSAQSVSSLFEGG
jgi:ribose-phosphate pyrophosphokinase